MNSVKLNLGWSRRIFSLRCWNLSWCVFSSLHSSSTQSTGDVKDHHYHACHAHPPHFSIAASCSYHPLSIPTLLIFLFPLQELKLPVYRAHSPQIGMRRYFADLLAILSNRYQLCPTARHLAVYLLDLFMDHYDVAVKQLYIITLSCLLLASKFTISWKKIQSISFFVWIFFLSGIIQSLLFLMAYECLILSWKDCFLKINNSFR